MKKAAILMGFFTALLIVSSCRSFTGITYNPGDDSYYVTRDAAINHRAYKCKKVGTKLICKQINKKK